MLRFNFCNTSRIACCSLGSAFSSMLSTQQRNVAVFTESNDTLKNAAKHKGYKSNVWFEEEDVTFIARFSKLKPNQAPVEISGIRRLELFNADQIDQQSASVPKLEEPQNHSSLRTGAQYSPRFQKDLAKIAQTRGFTSKWWFSKREAQKRGFQLQRGAYPNAFLVKGSQKLFNADQFENPQRVAREPVSGLSRKVMGKAVQSTLLEFAEKNDFPTGLFFTASQLDKFDLKKLLKENQKPALVNFGDLPGKYAGGGPNANLKEVVYYHVTELENWEQLLNNIGRFPIAGPTNLLSGKPITGTTFLEKIQASPLASESGKESLRNYWISRRDLYNAGTMTSQKLKLKEGAVGVVVRNASNATDAPETQQQNAATSMFNAHQLSEPEAAFKVAGNRLI